MSDIGEQLQPHMQDILDKIKRPLHLDRWTMTLLTTPLDDGRAECMAMPEYREAAIGVDPNKLKTGDDLAELVVHEAGAHPHVWPLHAVAEHLANALASSAPEYMREALRTLLQEWVRNEAERVTTDVGHAYLRLLREAKHLPSPADTE